MRLQICYTEKDFPIEELGSEIWQEAREISIEKYWSGDDAPVGRHAKARLLWSPTALYVRFEANQNEPLNVSQNPNLKSKTIGLWDRDVCEIFIEPDANEPRRYFEFEIAPNGEWVDLEVRFLCDERKTDRSYNSKMQSSAKIEKDRVRMAIRIEWKAFGKRAKAGDVWLGNLFRIVGSGETRGYLAWLPTKTEKPNFHVPEIFGEFMFVK